MSKILFYAGAGYLSGSILFARLFESIFKKEIVKVSPDQNPGTFNAFRYGGFQCGILTLICDLLKGFLPVFLYLQTGVPEKEAGLAFVLAAPVVGHIFPIFYEFKGGKGIAVSFGVLLGLLPEYRPVAILALFFLFFSLVLKVTPHYHRTLFSYFFSLIGVGKMVPNQAVTFGFLLITGVIMVKLYLSDEKKEKCKVEMVWKH